MCLCQGNNSGMLSFVFFPSIKCSLHILLWKLTSDEHRPINDNHTCRIFVVVGNVKALFPCSLVGVDYAAALAVYHACM